MGQYLSIGICNKIAVNRKKIESKGFTLNDVEKELNKKFELSLFVINETGDDYFVWDIKKDIFKQELYNFLSKIYLEYGVVREELLKKIKNSETGDDIYNLAEIESHENFHLDEYSEYDYIELGTFKNYQEINTTYISLFLVGKISMECYGQMFSFFTKTMRKVYSEFNLSGALNVYITG